MGQQSSIQQLDPDNAAIYRSLSEEAKAKLRELDEKNRQLGPCVDRLSEMRQKYYQTLVETNRQLVLAEETLKQEQNRLVAIAKGKTECEASQQALSQELKQKIQFVRDTIDSHEQMVRLHDTNDKQIEQLKIQIEQSEKQSIQCEINRDFCYERKELLRTEFKSIVDELDAQKQTLVMKLKM